MADVDSIVAGLRRLRRSRRVRQHELARDLGVAQATVSRWETGDRLMTTADVLAYAAALHCEVALVPTRLPTAAFLASAAVVDWPRPVEDVPLPEETP